MQLGWDWQVSVTTSDTRQCVYCSRLVCWRWHGQRLKDGAKIYLDAQGRRWAGRRCASCEKKRVQTALRFNRFDRMLLTKELAARGYRVKKFANPIIAEADGKTCYIPVRKACTDGREITIEEPLPDDSAESLVLLFSSSRVFSREQIEQMAASNTLQVFD